jgi:hypothetical protein
LNTSITEIEEAGKAMKNERRDCEDPAEEKNNRAYNPLPSLKSQAGLGGVWFR